MLIVIEGLDGSGKSTQVSKVADYISNELGRNLHYLHFPRFDAPVVGGMIARFLRGEFGAIGQVHPMLVALLFAEDRRDAAGMIRQWLSEGDVVLLDRYVYSNIAFQCAKLEGAESDSLSEWIFRTEYSDFGIPKPDLNVFLDVPIAFVKDRLSDQRQGEDREYLEGKQDIHEADMAFQSKVREKYLQSCASDPDFIKVDCSDNSGNMLPPDGIFGLLKAEIDRVLTDCKCE